MTAALASGTLDAARFTSYLKLRAPARPGSGRAAARRAAAGGERSGPGPDGGWLAGQLATVVGDLGQVDANAQAGRRAPVGERLQAEVGRGDRAVSLPSMRNLGDRPGPTLAA